MLGQINDECYDTMGMIDPSKCPSKNKSKKVVSDAKIRAVIFPYRNDNDKASFKPKYCPR